MEILSLKLNTKENFGISSEYVLHISQKMDISATSCVHNKIEGMLSFRGTIIPVLKMSSITNIEEGEAQIIVILKDENSDNTFGLLAEKVNEVIEIPDEQIIDVKSIFFGESSNYITHVAKKTDDILISILNIPGLQKMFRLNERSLN